MAFNDVLTSSAEHVDPAPDDELDDVAPEDDPLTVPPDDELEEEELDEELDDDELELLDEDPDDEELDDVAPEDDPDDEDELEDDELEDDDPEEDPDDELDEDELDPPDEVVVPVPMLITIVPSEPMVILTLSSRLSRPTCWSPVKSLCSNASIRPMTPLEFLRRAAKLLSALAISSARGRRIVLTIRSAALI